MRGRRNKDKPQFNPALPPCRVCGEPGSGFHYGVTTCGACKGFFRRSLVRKEPYVCIQSNLCHVGPSTTRRQSCPKCRYDKCVSLGMSKDACKVGRYSLVKKSTDLMEIMEHKHIVPGDNTSNVDDDDEHTREEVITNPSPHLESFHSPITETSSEGSENVAVECQDIKGACSQEEEMEWNFGRHNERSQHERDTSFSSSPDSNDSLSFKNNVCAENSSDGSSPSADSGVDLSTAQVPVTTQQHQIETKFIPTTGPLYTILESRVPTSTFLHSVRLETPRTTPYSLCFDMNKYSNLSPPTVSPDSFAHNPNDTDDLSIPHTQNHSSTTNNTLGTSGTASSFYAVQQNNTELPSNFSNPDGQLMMTTQQSLRQGQQQQPGNFHTPLVPHTSQQGYTPLYTESNGQSTRYSTSPDIDSKYWLDSLCKDSDCCGIINGTQDLSLGNREHSTLDVSSAIIKPDIFGDLNTSTNHTHGGDAFLLSDYFPHKEVSNYSRGGGIEGEMLTINNRFKRPNDGDDGNEKHQKMPVLSQPSEPMPIVLPPSLIFLSLSPELSQGKTSLFERCPFVSYERQVLEPLLKQCYEVNEYLPYSIKRSSENQASLNMRSGQDSCQPSVNESSIVKVLTSAPPPELLDYTLSLNYDYREMDNLLDHLKAINERYFGLMSSSFMSESDIKAAQDRFWNLCQLKDKIHGRLNFIDDKKYFEILNSTGIDVDKRKEWLLTYLNIFEGTLPTVIKFFRSVPGFKDLTLADKITLTKSNLLPYNLLSASRGLDEIKLIVVDGEKKTACRFGVIPELVPQVKEIHHHIIALLSFMKSLKLSYEEIILFKALIITTPNPGDVLEEPEVVRECHQVYQKCLLNMERKRHGSSGDERFAKMFDMLQKFNGIRGEMMTFRQETSRHLFRLVEDSTLWLVKESFFNITRPNTIKGE